MTFHFYEVIIQIVEKPQQKNGRRKKRMNYTKLRGLIRSKFKTQEAFALAVGLSPCSVSKKLNGKTEWSADEIRKVCEVMGISPEDIPKYFFCSEC